MPCTQTTHYHQGDHLSEKPGNVREFDNCQGNVRDFTKCQGKNLVREKFLKLFIISCIFASIQIFSRSLFSVKYYIYGFGSCSIAFLHPPLTVTLVQA